jgi:hypothetical protein
MSGMSRAIGLATWLALAFCAAVDGNPQIRLTGRVSNETNVPVAGARITAESVSLTSSFSATSDPTGVFELMLPEPGAYSLKVDREGYYIHSEPPMMLPAGAGDAPTEVHVVLQTIHEIRSSVDVTDQPGMVDMDRTSPQTTLSSRTLFDVPFPNQNSLRSGLRMIPGVVQDSLGGLHLFGGSESQAQYTFEGFELNDPLTGRFDARMSLESVQSVDVTAQSGADSGRGEAGTMAIHARTGGDKFSFSATNVFPGIDTGKGVRIGSWTPRGDFSGPWWKGRAWFFNTTELQYTNTLIPQLPDGQNRQTSWRANSLLHNQINLGPRDILFIGLLFNYFFAPQNGLSVLDPRSTTVDRRSNQWFGYIKNQHFFSHASLLEFGVAASRTFSRETPQGDAPYEITPSGRLGNYFVHAKRVGEREQALTNFYLPPFRFLGAHQLKAGADAVRLDYAQNVSRGPIDYIGLDGNTFRQVNFLGSGILSRVNYEDSVYLQDAWRIRPSLLIEVGLRADHDFILNHWNPSPRAGFAWSPPGWENTRISGGVATIYNFTDLAVFTRPLDQYTTSTLFNPDGSIASGPLASVYSRGIDVRTPRATTWNLGAQQQFPKLIQAKIQLLRRRSTDGFSYANVLGPNGGLPGGIDYTGLPVQLAAVYALTNQRQDHYDSVELSVRQPLKGRYEWMLSYTRSRALSNAVLEHSIDQPLAVSDNSGALPWDAPNRLLSWGYLPTWWKNWAIAYLLDWHSGFPFSVQDQYGQLAGAVDDHRFHDFFELNFFVERQMTVRGYRIALRGGFNNITGHSNPNVVDNVVGGPTYLQQYGGQSRALNFRLRYLGRQ